MKFKRERVKTKSLKYVTLIFFFFSFFFFFLIKLFKFRVYFNRFNIVYERFKTREFFFIFKKKVILKLLNVLKIKSFTIVK